MEHRFPGGDRHREHRHCEHYELDTEVDVPWQPANHKSVERKLFANQFHGDGEQLELQRDDSGGRKIRRHGLYRKPQRNQFTAGELLSEWNDLPLVFELANFGHGLRAILFLLCSGRRRRPLAWLHHSPRDKIQRAFRWTKTAGLRSSSLQAAKAPAWVQIKHSSSLRAERC